MKSTAPRHFNKSLQVASLVVFAWAAFGPVAGISARSHRLKNLPVIKVGVYNYADVDRSELRKAERLAAILFAQAGVRIAWAEYPYKFLSGRYRSNDLAPDFSVRILYASTILPYRWISGTDVMGVSFIPSGNKGPLPGGIADVFYDRVMKFSSAPGVYSGDVLGEAIAHELGHLLLGPRHSPSGIMKLHWTRRDLELITRCELRFLSAQVVSLQRAAWSLQRNPSLTVTAQR
jgi:hypothetical protein